MLGSFRPTVLRVKRRREDTEEPILIIHQTRRKRRRKITTDNLVSSFDRDFSLQLGKKGDLPSSAHGSPTKGDRKEQQKGDQDDDHPVVVDASDLKEPPLESVKQVYRLVSSGHSHAQAKDAQAVRRRVRAFQHASGFADGQKNKKGKSNPLTQPPTRRWKRPTPMKRLHRPNFLRRAAQSGGRSDVQSYAQRLVDESTPPRLKAKRPPANPSAPRLGTLTSAQSNGVGSARIGVETRLRNVAQQLAERNARFQESPLTKTASPWRGRKQEEEEKKHSRERPEVVNSPVSVDLAQLDELERMESEERMMDRFSGFPLARRLRDANADLEDAPCVPHLSFADEDSADTGSADRSREERHECKGETTSACSAFFAPSGAAAGTGNGKSSGKVKDLDAVLQRIDAAWVPPDEWQPVRQAMAREEPRLRPNRRRKPRYEGVNVVDMPGDEERRLQDESPVADDEADVEDLLHVIDVARFGKRTRGRRINAARLRRDEQRKLEMEAAEDVVMPDGGHGSDSKDSDDEVYDLYVLDAAVDADSVQQETGAPVLHLREDTQFYPEHVITEEQHLMSEELNDPDSEHWWGNDYPGKSSCFLPDELQEPDSDEDSSDSAAAESSTGSDFDEEETTGQRTARLGAQLEAQLKIARDDEIDWEEVVEPTQQQVQGRLYGSGTDAAAAQRRSLWFHQQEELNKAARREAEITAAGLAPLPADSSDDEEEKGSDTEYLQRAADTLDFYEQFAM